MTDYKQKAIFATAVAFSSLCPLGYANLTTDHPILMTYQCKCLLFKCMFTPETYTIILYRSHKPVYSVVCQIPISLETLVCALALCRHLLSLCVFVLDNFLWI